MKSRFFGGLCIVTFAITLIAGLTLQGNFVEAKDSASKSTLSESTQSNRSWVYNIFRKKEEKKVATRLAIVVGKNCPPCRRMKLYTLPVLLAEGYDVWTVPVETWNKKNPKNQIKSWPTLVYLTEKNEVVRQEPGFRTPEQVKKYLHKVEKS